MKPWLKGWRHCEARNGAAGIAPEVNVKVAITDVRVEHEVKLSDFTNGWIDRAAFHRER